MAKWNAAQRALFRFAFVFWGLYCVRGGLLWQALWWFPWLFHWTGKWVWLAQDWLLGKLRWELTTRVLHLPASLLWDHPTGSGDTARAWLEMLALLVFSAAATLLWTAIAEWGIRKRGWRRDYRTLYAWLRLAMRFTLAAVLLGYGFSKVFDLQFSTPGAYQLQQTYGQSSPMGLLWTFMGASVPYTIFAGLAEVIPGLLLLFRRTATLGALSAAAVMLNVAMLNFCYDVPVKLYSTTLLMMALFLLLPDMAPLWRLLIGGREARLCGVAVPRPERRALRWASFLLQALIIGNMLWSNITGMMKQRREYAAMPAYVPPNTGIDGKWIVDDSTGWPAAEAWKTVDIGGARFKSVDAWNAVLANGQTFQYSVGVDWSGSVHFLKLPDTELHWTKDAKGNATLEGTWKGQPARLRMHPVPATYPLLTRGFHWVQEKPFNR